VHEDVGIMAREKNKLCVGEDGVLYMKTKTRHQLVLPKTFSQLVYKELHEEIGHLVALKKEEAKQTNQS